MRSSRTRLVALARRYGDPVFAVTFAVLWLTGVVGGPLPAGRVDLAVFGVSGLLLTVPFAWRRRFPVAVALVVFATGLATSLVVPSDLPIGFVLSALLAGYSLGSADLPLRRSATVLTAMLVLAAITGTRHNDSGIAGIVLTPVLFVAAPWALARLVSRLREERSALHRLTIRLEREQEQVARASVLEERSRIARELHDIVAHSIGVMVVQAGAAEQYVATDSPAREPLEAIRTTGQQALAEMRTLLGILRTEDTAELALAPQPGLANLDALVDAARRSGLEVEVLVQGEPMSLPPGVDVAAYRLVQESFSNVRKHARARSTAVTLRYEPRCLTIEVADDGIGRETGRGVEEIGGHGLIGMRERVSLYGGRLDCGPRATGGWRVWAQLPLAG